ncbi:MAG: polyamine aminopropyltransferase [Deltaproteobacteria bacterium]|nr:polyamine aminopropyltransferase [Deltaproteobacteria bacterium]
MSPALLASVVVIATSGLVYELIAGTMASYVLGDSVTQFSFVIGLYLFAMGLGSYASKHIERDLLQRFVEIELTIALVGGFSAPLLFTVYTSFGAFRAALYITVTLVGMLVGLEIPLLIRLLEYKLALKDLLARVLSLDYVGALFASLLFPLVLLPKLGIHNTSMLIGLLNALVALGATFLFPLEHGRGLRMRVQCVLVALGLVVGLVAFDRHALRGEATYFGAPIVYATQSSYQRLVITQTRHTTRLFLNGQLQFSSDDEHRYHETLVHPAVAALGHAPKHALVLGGGDGLAVRELLRYPELERVTLVDLDPAVTGVFRTVTLARTLNGGALDDPRVTVRNEDAFAYLEGCKDSFDLALVDFPDPGNYAVGKLYTLTFYQRLRQRLSTRGIAVVQTTSPYFARRSFWMAAETIAAADFAIHPMHVHVPSFGEWGFVLAGPPGFAPPTTLLVPEGGLRYLDERELAGLFRFPRDMERVSVGVNRLNDQQLVSIYTEEWDHWQR